ncbi:NUDIX hydrolase [Paenibacillus sp. strain BS8-2]
MNDWYELNEIDHELVNFAVLLAKFKNQFIIIHNKNRGGWEIPGGKREIGESILQAASRELYEETGAVRFELIPFGIYQWRGSFGMVFNAEVEELSKLPGFEIEEIKFEDVLPLGMNFGEMFYIYNDKWNQITKNTLTKYNIDINNLKKFYEIKIV